jgi:hypothetical protein
MYLVDKYKIKVNYICPDADPTEDQNMIETENIDIFVDDLTGLLTVLICECACCAHTHFIPLEGGE